MLEEKNQEIQSLKAQLAARPTVESFQRLQDELLARRSEIIDGATPSNGESKDQSIKADMDNVLAIFSYLKLPNLPSPSDSNISAFLVSLRAVLERTHQNQSNNSTPATRTFGSATISPTRI